MKSIVYFTNGDRRELGDEWVVSTDSGSLYLERVDSKSTTLWDEPIILESQIYPAGSWVRVVRVVQEKI